MIKKTMIPHDFRSKFWVLNLLSLGLFVIAFAACNPPKPANNKDVSSTANQRQTNSSTASPGPASSPQNSNRAPQAPPPVVDGKSKELVGKIVGVHDGDTVTLLDRNKVQYKIRLSGIDAPELGQDFGRRSKDNLAALIFGKDVLVIHDKLDRYGRVVGKIIFDNIDINLRQVEDGLAWHFKRYENEQSAEDRVTYSEAENRARSAKSGLWVQPNPEPPWERRHPSR